MPADIRRDEPRATGIDVLIARARLAVRIEALRYDQIEFVLGARHGDIQKTPFLLDLFARAGGQVGRDAAIHHIQDRDGFPFLALGGMDGGVDEIIFVEQRLASFVACGLRRVEREIGQKLLT